MKEISKFGKEDLGFSPYSTLHSNQEIPGNDLCQKLNNKIPTQRDP